MLDFPCEYQIKAMAASDCKLEALLERLLLEHLGKEEIIEFRRKESKQGRFCSVTVLIRASSKDQLDDIYRSVTSCDEIVFAL